MANPPISAFERTEAMTGGRVLLDPKNPQNLKYYTKGDIRWRTRNPLVLLWDIHHGIRLYHNPTGEKVAEVNRAVMRALVGSLKQEYSENIGNMAAHFLKPNFGEGSPLTDRTVKMVLNKVPSFMQAENRNQDLARRFSDPLDYAFQNAVDRKCRELGLQPRGLDLDTIEKLRIEIQKEIEEAAQSNGYYRGLSEEEAEGAALRAAQRILAGPPSIAFDNPAGGAIAIGIPDGGDMDAGLRTPPHNTDLSSDGYM